MILRDVTTVHITITNTGWGHKTPKSTSAAQRVCHVSLHILLSRRLLLTPPPPSKTPILSKVFSDEFSTPHRTFADGEDPVWTALDKNDYTNAALHYYESGSVSTEGGKVSSAKEGGGGGRIMPAWGGRRRPRVVVVFRVVLVCVGFVTCTPPTARRVPFHSPPLLLCALLRNIYIYTHTHTR